MDRLVRARVLLAEASALGVTIDDLVAASSDARRSTSTAPTVAERAATSARLRHGERASDEPLDALKLR